VPPIPQFQPLGKETICPDHAPAVEAAAPADHAVTLPVDVGRVVEGQLLSSADVPFGEDGPPRDDAVRVAGMVDQPPDAVPPCEYVPIIVNLEGVGPENLWYVPNPPRRPPERRHPCRGTDEPGREDAFPPGPRISNPEWNHFGFASPYLAMHKGSMHLSWGIPLAVEEPAVQRKAEGTCMSFMVNSPGGEPTTFGTMLTSMATVPWSPWTHGFILQFTGGIPSIST